MDRREEIGKPCTARHRSGLDCAGSGDHAGCNCCYVDRHYADAGKEGILYWFEENGNLWRLPSCGSCNRHTYIVAFYAPDTHKGVPNGEDKPSWTKDQFSGSVKYPVEVIRDGRRVETKQSQFDRIAVRLERATLCVADTVRAIQHEVSNVPVLGEQMSVMPREAWRRVEEALEGRDKAASELRDFLK